METKYLLGTFIVLLAILATLLVLSVSRYNNPEPDYTAEAANYISEEVTNPNDIYINDSAVPPSIEQSEKEVEIFGEVMVVINNFNFYPKGIVITPGTSVTWFNNDTVPHKVVAYDRLFYGQRMGPGEKYTFTFTKEGSHSYFDAVFPKSGRGKIIVQEEPLPITGGVVAAGLNKQESDGKFALATILIIIMILGLSHGIYTHRRI